MRLQLLKGIRLCNTGATYAHQAVEVHLLLTAPSKLQHSSLLLVPEANRGAYHCAVFCFALQVQAHPERVIGISLLILIATCVPVFK